MEQPTQAYAILEGLINRCFPKALVKYKERIGEFECGWEIATGCEVLIVVRAQKHYVNNPSGFSFILYGVSLSQYSDSKIWVMLQYNGKFEHLESAEEVRFLEMLLQKFIDVR